MIHDSFTASYFWKVSKEFSCMMFKKSLPLFFNYPSTQRLLLLFNRSLFGLQFLEKRSVHYQSRSFKIDITFKECSASILTSDNKTTH